MNAAGISATAARTITVYDDCTVPEVTCRETLNCSTFGSCSSLLGALSGLGGGSGSGSAAAQVSAPLAARVDTTPPVITITGTLYLQNALGQLADGTFIMSTYVVKGTVYVDEGRSKLTK